MIFLFDLVIFVRFQPFSDFRRGNPGWFFNVDTMDVAQGLSMSHVFYSDKGWWINDRFGHVCWDTCCDFKFLVELWFILVMRTCFDSNTYLRRWSNLTSLFQFFWNHQLVCFFKFHIFWASKSQSYCWWKKSCTTWDVWNPINNEIFTISTG